MKFIVAKCHSLKVTGHQHQKKIHVDYLEHARIQIGAGTEGLDPPPPPPENRKAIGLLSNTDPDTLENNKATKPALNIMVLVLAFRRRADNGSLLVVFGSLPPHQLRVKLGPL